MARKGNAALYAAMTEVANKGLIHGDSAFAPGRPAWSSESFEELKLKFVDRPLHDDRKFYDKLRDQLSDASDEAILLMAELHYVYFLISRTMHGDTKRDQITQDILGLMAEPVLIPDDLAKALDHGFINPGTYYMTAKDRQIAYLVNLGVLWTQLEPVKQQSLLDDPWRFKTFAGSIVERGTYAQMAALLHLLFPDEFEAIVSQTHKELIVTRFAGQVSSESTDLDRRLLEIRTKLAPEHHDRSFYDESLVNEWKHKGNVWTEFVDWARRIYSEPDFEERERENKLEVAEATAAARSALLAAGDWHTALHRALKHPHNNLTDWRTHSKFLKWLDSESVRTDSENRAEAALRVLWSDGEVSDRIMQFVELISGAELSGIGNRIGLASFLLMGEDAAEYPFYKPTPFSKARDLTQTPSPSRTASAAEAYLTALDFLDTFIDESSNRGLEIRDRLDAQGLVWALVNWKPPEHWKSGIKSSFEKWRTGTTVHDPQQPLSNSLYLPSEFLDNIEKLLKDKQQVIFHGPPGTGKTFVARKLAEHLTGSADSVDIVQFHPSYSYEDFVQGFRPRTDGDGFKLRDGPLLRAARRALSNPDSIQVLIIDEINRGNLAKVFGELYYLLEYRSSEMSLQYADEPFRLPENLWIIGTMNTADRSIAIVDGALRRRFYFVPFLPDEAPIDGLLYRWLAVNKPEFGWIADVVRRANDLLGDRHAAIGPSHFMRPDLDDSWIELIWNHSVLPYIEEQLFAEPERISEFSLEALRAT